MNENEKKVIPVEWIPIKLDKEQVMLYYCKNSIKIVFQCGDVDINGWSPKWNNEYTVSAERKGAVVSFKGALLRVKSNSPNIIEKSFNIEILDFSAINNLPYIYLNIYSALERNIRTRNMSHVLVLGNELSGAGIFAHTMVNYGVRMGHTPNYVDVDVKDNSITLNDAIAAMIVRHPYTIADSWNLVNDTITYLTPNSEELDVTIYKQQINYLASKLGNQRKNDSGFIVKSSCFDTCGSNNKNVQLDLIKFLMDTFKITNIFVFDNEELMQTLFSNNIMAIHLPKTYQNLEYTNLDMRLKIGSYFLNSHTNRIILTEITIPLNQKYPTLYYYNTNVGEYELIPLCSSEFDFKTRVLAVVNTTNPNLINSSTVLGFVRVSYVYDDNTLINIQCPFGSQIPNNTLLVLTSNQGDILF